jgi:hypothetical protein
MKKFKTFNDYFSFKLFLLAYFHWVDALQLWKLKMAYLKLEESFGTSLEKASTIREK